MRVQVRPELLRWARERAGLSPEALARRIPQLQAWERGDAKPTLKQVEKFAKATYTPVGFLFLSPDLLDTVYICQQRQEWYRDFARSEGEDRLPFVGSSNLTSDIRETAARMRTALGFNIDERRRIPTWTDALRRFIEQADLLGVLVMSPYEMLRLERARFVLGAPDVAVAYHGHGS